MNLARLKKYIFLLNTYLLFQILVKTSHLLGSGRIRGNNWHVIEQILVIEFDKEILLSFRQLSIIYDVSMLRKRKETSQGSCNF